MKNDLLTITYDRLVEARETKLAWCVEIAGQLIFLPKSQVEDIRETVRELDLPRWLVEAKGLEGYVA